MTNIRSIWTNANFNQSLNNNYNSSKPTIIHLRLTIKRLLVKTRLIWSFTRKTCNHLIGIVFSWLTIYILNSTEILPIWTQSYINLTRIWCKTQVIVGLGRMLMLLIHFYSTTSQLEWLFYFLTILRHYKDCSISYKLDNMNRMQMFKETVPKTIL